MVAKIPYKRRLAVRVVFTVSLPLPSCLPLAMANQEQQQVSVEKDTPFSDPLTAGPEQTSLPETTTPEAPARVTPPPEAVSHGEGKGEEQTRDPALSLSDELVEMDGICTVMNGR